MNNRGSGKCGSKEEPSWGPRALMERREKIKIHQAGLSESRTKWINMNKYYYDYIWSLLQFIVEPGKSVFNIRCETGHLLKCIEPSRALGQDVSPEMIDLARKEFEEADFFVSDSESIKLDEKFDYILLNQVNDITDVLLTIKNIRENCHSHSRLVVMTYNHLWSPVLKMAEFLGIRMPLLEQNWLSETDLKTLMSLAGFEWIRTYRTILIPVWIPLISKIANDFIARLPGFRRLCMINILISRPNPHQRDAGDVSVSVVVPCKDEAGNIRAAVERIPEMGKGTEILFCDDKSEDGTRDEIIKMQKECPHRNIRLIDGPGINKALNVWTGFEHATGDVLMILDGDLTVMPEELPYFFEAIVSGSGEFINGVRLIYPLPKGTMKISNLIGNKVFSLLFSMVLGQRVKDTLCGTKVLWRSDWKRLKEHIGSWGTVDRWGDFELLFGAAKINLRIIDLPVHYQERIFGVTKMVKVLGNGLNMLRMTIHAYIRFRVGF